ncbi:unnamed protein product [Symbiodinium pilosum]|uniref:Uncharacterized protein n=1 Tax=Symbiodinium pilosum TaxID=2952 RepID=A0A812KJY8_SYMPI|nr:unnamed protein product [Symbiodinium pilosum]
MGQTPPELSRRVQASSYFYLQFGLFASCSVDWSGHGGLRRRNTVDAGPEHEEPDFEASVSDATSGVCADIFREVCDWMSDSQSEACQNPDWMPPPWQDSPHSGLVLGHELTGKALSSGSPGRGPITVYVRSLNGKLLLELPQARYRHLLILPLKHFVCGLLHICPNTCFKIGLPRDPMWWN